MAHPLSRGFLRGGPGKRNIKWCPGGGEVKPGVGLHTTVMTFLPPCGTQWDSKARFRCCGRRRIHSWPTVSWWGNVSEWGIGHKVSRGWQLVQPTSPWKGATKTAQGGLGVSQAKLQGLGQGGGEAAQMLQTSWYRNVCSPKMDNPSETPHGNKSRFCSHREHRKEEDYCSLETKAGPAFKKKSRGAPAHSPRGAAHESLGS